MKDIASIVEKAKALLASRIAQDRRSASDHGEIAEEDRSSIVDEARHIPEALEVSESEHQTDDLVAQGPSPTESSPQAGLDHRQGTCKAPESTITMANGAINHRQSSNGSEIRGLPDDDSSMWRFRDPFGMRAYTGQRIRDQLVKDTAIAANVALAWNRGRGPLPVAILPCDATARRDDHITEIIAKNNGLGVEVWSIIPIILCKSDNLCGKGRHYKFYASLEWIVMPSKRHQLQSVISEALSGMADPTSLSGPVAERLRESRKWQERMRTKSELIKWAGKRSMIDVRAHMLELLAWDVTMDAEQVAIECGSMLSKLQIPTV